MSHKMCVIFAEDNKFIGTKSCAGAGKKYGYFCKVYMVLQNRKI